MLVDHVPLPVAWTESPGTPPECMCVSSGCETNPCRSAGSTSSWYPTAPVLKTASNVFKDLYHCPCPSSRTVTWRFWLHVSYLTDDKQPFFEEHSGLVDLLGADLGAPHVERFPLLEAGEEGDAGDLLVVGVLVLPAVQGHVLVLVVAHRERAVAADHQVVVLVVGVDLDSRGSVQVASGLDGEWPSGGTWASSRIAGRLRRDGGNKTN